MATNKAITYDGVTDILFSKKFMPKVKDLLTNQWSCNKYYLNHFETRLVPLNKVHPKIPKANEFRPIIIQSPILKFLEARFQQSSPLI